MKLDRNINPDGAGKYAIINMRKLRGTLDDAGQYPAEIVRALQELANAGALEWGSVGNEDEFFLVKLKDRHAHPALLAYADSIRATDPEFAEEVDDMAQRAGDLSPWCKEPD